MEFSLKKLVSNRFQISLSYKDISTSSEILLPVRKKGEFIDDYIITSMCLLKTKLNEELNTLFTKNILNKKILLTHTIISKKNNKYMNMSICSINRMETKTFKVSKNVVPHDSIIKDFNIIFSSLFKTFFINEKDPSENIKKIRNIPEEVIREARKKQIQKDLEKYKLTEKQKIILNYAYYKRVDGDAESFHYKGFFTKNQMDEKLHHDIFNLMVDKKLLLRKKVKNEYQYKITQVGIDVADMLKFL